MNVKDNIRNQLKYKDDRPTKEKLEDRYGYLNSPSVARLLRQSNAVSPKTA